MLKMRFVGLLGLLATSGMARADLNDGLVAYYPFNGNANDESGNGHDGKVVNAKLTADKAGIPNKAYLFNGKDSYIAISDSNDLRLENKVFSLSIKIKPDKKYEEQVFIRKGVSCGAPGWDAGHSNEEWGNGVKDTIYFGSWDGYNKAWSDNAEKPITYFNNWHHIVFVADGNNSTIYMDGIKKSTSSINSSVNITSYSPIFIGAAPTGNCSPGGPHAFYNGLIDELRIYNRALSPEEIQ